MTAEELIVIVQRAMDAHAEAESWVGGQSVYDRLEEKSAESYSYMVKAIRALVYERDSAETEKRRVCLDFISVQDEMIVLRAQRDSLLAENAKMKTRIVAYAEGKTNGVNFCRICNEYNYAPKTVNHTPDCILFELEAK